jgi:glyoxylase-like metal-dependent hydrolase (beta-lactamase superfamily II)
MQSYFERTLLMKRNEHGNNLIQLTFYGFVNVYLVREDDGFTVVDTGVEACAKKIVEVAQKTGLPIVRILPTHAHPDHTGGVDALHALVPNAELIMPARDARLLAGDMTLDANEPQNKLKGRVVSKTVPTRLVNEGDRVGSLQVIASPGHTPGHASFLDARDRTLIAGDAFQTMGAVAVSGTMTIFPLPAIFTWHKGLALESARKLRGFEPSRMAVGHGRVLEQPAAAMDHAIEVATRKLGQSGQIASGNA